MNHRTRRPRAVAIAVAAPAAVPSWIGILAALATAAAALLAG